MSMPTMRRFRPFAAITSAGLLFQLILAGSGFGCVMQTMPHPTSQDAAMAGMATGMEMPLSDQTVPPASDETPCRLPWAPVGCQPMAPCSPAVMPSAIVILASVPGPVQSVTGRVAIAPPTRTIPPEPPPPRA